MIRFFWGKAYLVTAAIAAFAAGRYAGIGDWPEAIGYACMAPLWAIEGIARLR